MEYSSTVTGSNCEMGFRGKFAFSDNETVQKIIADFKSSSCTSCLIDLSGLETIDSAGLGMLLLINDAIQEDGNSVELHSATGQVQKMLEISKFSEVISIRP